MTLCFHHQQKQRCSLLPQLLLLPLLLLARGMARRHQHHQ
jgi:hypothetical protein